MYDEMTITDLIVTAHQKAHPEDQPSSENALLIDELARRLRRFDNWRSKVSAEINPYLTDDDGSDLLPEPERIRNMLKRLSSAQAAPAPDGEVGPSDDDLALVYHDCCGGCDLMDQVGFEDAARAVLARWGTPNQAEIRSSLGDAPVPVASDVYFEFVVSDADYCTQAGGIAPTYAQALDEGQRYLAQYQQDGVHTLELRRVEVLGSTPPAEGEVAELVAALSSRDRWMQLTDAQVDRAATLLEQLSAAPMPVVDDYKVASDKTMCRIRSTTKRWKVTVTITTNDSAIDTRLGVGIWKVLDTENEILESVSLPQLLLSNTELPLPSGEVK